MFSRLPLRDLPQQQIGACVCACMHARAPCERALFPTVASQVFGVQRCKARVRPKRGGHGACERVILEVDLRHCWQQGDRVGDGADKAVLLEEAASNETRGDHLILPRKSLCEPDALRQRCVRSKRYCREERAALHAREVHELADRWMDRPVERVARQVAARIPKAQAPLAADGRLRCAASAHTMPMVCITEGFAASSIINGSPARSTRGPVALPRPSRIMDSLD